MIIRITDDFDLKKIADSGQCFRWEPCYAQKTEASGSGALHGLEREAAGRAALHGLEREAAGRAAENGLEQDTAGVGSDNESTQAFGETYRILAGDRCLYITALGDSRFELECTQEEYRDFWQDYFDLEEDYRSIRERIKAKEDPFLFEAAQHERGIRILRQDPWEMLISFIISQNKNIPAIRRSVDMLAQRCADRRVDSRGMEYYAFPKAEVLAGLSEEDLMACKLGYRWKYVQAAARAVESGEIDLDRLLNADEDTTISSLTELFGVGVKVANCISLFGLHHIDAFPVDVWVKRILAEQYPGGYPRERYSPYNGICQQYMFAYYRNR